MQQKQLIDDTVYRGHMIQVWHNPNDDTVEVSSNIRDDNIIADYENKDWAVYAMRQYIDGWKAAGGN